MKTKFLVTGDGMQIDGRGLLPGSELLLKSAPPSHWGRFGVTEQAAEEPATQEPKEMVVATPPKRGRPRKKAD